MGNEIWRVFYRSVFLGYFDENELRTKKNQLGLHLIVRKSINGIMLIIRSIDIECL